MPKLKLSLMYLLCHLINDFRVESKVTDKEYNLMPKLFHLDDFDKCMSLKEKALYCSVSIQLTPENPHNKSSVWNVIQDVIDDPKNYRHDLLRHGICIPKACPLVELGSTNKNEFRDGISSCYTSKYEHLGLKASVTEIHCETEQPFYPIDNYDVAVGVVFGVIIGIVIIATFYEGLARYKPKEKHEKLISTPVGRILNCFSLPANWSRLTKGRSNTEDSAFNGLNGIRFYNTQLVIMAHVTLTCAAGSVLNPTFIENLTRKPENMIFVNGASNIQTFFLITGYLISYNFLLVFEKRRQFKLRYLVLAFINRYIRLTPCLLVMMAFNATWLYHISRGPIWDRLVGTEYRNCRKNWWANLLYINNYYDVEEMCMQHSWYLATDMQLFLAALVVVGFMWKYQNRIKLILGTSLAIGVTMTSIINYYNNYDIVVRQYPENYYKILLNVPEWRVIYSSSLTNFGGYTLGMVFGYIVYKKSKSHSKPFTKKIYVAIWWLLVWGLPLAVNNYGILIYQEGYQYTRLGAAVYVSLQKNLFALGICLLVYGLTEGIGWFLRDCIMWSPLQVLGRLTYCTYLVHVAVIRVRGGQIMTPTYISTYWICIQTVGDAVVSYIFGTLLALLVELPISALQKLVVPQLANEDNGISVKRQGEDRKLMTGKKED